MVDMIEIVSPAGSPEGVMAAVQNGADAVCLGFKTHNSCLSADNFTRNELGRALEYCRIRGVKTYLTLNTLAYDKQLTDIAEQAKEACRLGIDAIIVSDFGVMRAVRQAVPEIPVHADSRMGIHNIEGVKIATAMGFKRVLLSAELSHNKIKYICKNSPIEIGILVHGEMCVSYSDQCYLSAIQGTGSHNLGECSKPCRNSYSVAGYAAKYPLSIKDKCLAKHMDTIRNLGVTAIMIGDRQKRPEYSAIATGIYAKALHTQRPPSLEDMTTAEKHLTRYGLTDGYYNDNIGSDMFGMSNEKENPDAVVFSTARKNYLNGEYQRVPVRFVGTISKGKPVKLAGADDLKNASVVYGPIPAPSFHKELNETVLQTQLHKTGGTPFYCAGVKSKVEPGLSLPISSFDEMRQELLAEILDQRKPRPLRVEGEYIPAERADGYSEPEAISVFLTKIEQLSDALINLQPDLIYLPLTKIDFDDPKISALINHEKITLSVALPHIIQDNEKTRMSDLLTRAVKHGVKDVLIGNLGQIHLARTCGMTVRGDYSLNAFNSESIRVLRDLGLDSATLPFELSLTQLRQLSKPIDTELIVYGRLPLMLTENCIVKNSTGACTCDSHPSLINDDGAQFPIISDHGCRNILLSSRKLFMADKRKAISSVGAWAQRLNFTTENALECVSTLKRYQGLSDYKPSNFTRGLYFKS